MTIIHQQVAAILVFTKYLYICNYDIYIYIYIYIPIVINDYPWLSSIIYPLLSTIIQLLYIHYYPRLSDYYALLSIIVHYYPLHPWLSILIHYQALFNVSNGKMIPTNQSVSRGDELYDHHPVDEPPEIGHPLGMTRTTRGCVMWWPPSNSGATVKLWRSIWWHLGCLGALLLGIDFFEPLWRCFFQRQLPATRDRWGSRLQLFGNGAKQDITENEAVCWFCGPSWVPQFWPTSIDTENQMVWCWQAAFEGWFFGANAGLDSVWEVDGFRSSMFFSGWSFWLIMKSFLPWSLAAWTWQWKCSKPRMHKQGVEIHSWHGKLESEYLSNSRTLPQSGCSQAANHLSTNGADGSILLVTHQVLVMGHCPAMFVGRWLTGVLPSIHRTLLCLFEICRYQCARNILVRVLCIMCCVVCVCYYIYI